MDTQLNLARIAEAGEVYAEGLELNVAKMRHEDPEQLFTLLVQMGAQTAAAYEASDDSKGY